jgi:glycerol transport system ATP-binding protein
MLELTIYTKNGIKHYMTKIELENVTKFFGGKKVIDNVSISVESGDRTAILGPDKAGKSTLLSLIAGIEKPDGGRIYFDGKDVTRHPPQKRNVGMLVQTFALYPNLNVYENIASPLRARGLTTEEIDREVKEQAKSLGIDDILHHYPYEISGGECQRVATARALVKKAAVYLLDEPFTNLDYKLKESMRVELKRILDKGKGTIVLATPDPEEALIFAKTLVFLYDGKVLQKGPIEECYSKPVNISVGKYFCKPMMNLIEAPLVRKNKRSVLNISDELQLDVTHLNLPEECVVGLRPHNLYLVKEREGMLTISPTLELQENAGSEMIVRMKLNGSSLTMYTPFVKRLKEKSLRIFVDPCDFYIFSKKTGKFITKYQRG